MDPLGTQRSKMKNFRMARYPGPQKLKMMIGRQNGSKSNRIVLLIETLKCYHPRSTEPRSKKMTSVRKVKSKSSISWHLTIAFTWISGVLHESLSAFRCSCWVSGNKDTNEWARIALVGANCFVSSEFLSTIEV